METAIRTLQIRCAVEEVGPAFAVWDVVVVQGRAIGAGGAGSDRSFGRLCFLVIDGNVFDQRRVVCCCNGELFAVATASCFLLLLLQEIPSVQGESTRLDALLFALTCMAKYVRTWLRSRKVCQSQF